MATNPSKRGPAPISGARLTIDLDALAANWNLLDRHAAAAETGAAVKADGYGLGLEPVVRALSAAGCRTFFVALPEEGVRARRVAPDAVIYVLAGLIDGSAETLIANDLRPALHSLIEIEEWAAHRERGARTGSAIHVDTGMNRLGLSLHEALALARDPGLLAAVAPSLIMSHLACSDTPGHPQNVRQLALFREIRAEFPDIPASLANSAGVFLGEEYHFDLIRPGIALYGVGPVAGVENTMRPVVTAEARVLAVREAEAGETVGYGATETLKRASRIAILAAGYADGYHRLAGSSDERRGAFVSIRGARAPLVGRVSMDLMAVDVTDLRLVARGDWAELFGHAIPIDQVAHAADTIGYELLTSLGKRYARTYRGG